MKICLLMVSLFGFALPISPVGAPQKGGGKLAVGVDARVELFSIIFRLAGNPEYNQPNSKSPYSAAVERQFGKFRSHRVIKLARRLRGTSGVSYDAVISMAVHLSDTVKLNERVSLAKKPPRLDGRWKVPAAREFLVQARDFVKVTRFNAFFRKHKKLYKQAAKSLAKVLGDRPFVSWFNSFFGARPQAKFNLSVGMLLGGGCYGSGIRFLDGKEEILPVIGAWKFDGQGVPVFDRSIAGTVAHELCHSYTNAIVDKHIEQLQVAGKKIFATCADTMKRMAYGTMKTMLYESMVRACVIVYLKDTEGREAAKKEARRQYQKGFKWVPQLAACLVKYTEERKEYKRFDDFMPRVAEFFTQTAGELPKADAKAPRVINMVPTNGDRAVDPGLKEIRVTFDRPMMDGMWAVVGGGPNFPKLSGKLHYEQDCTVLVIPVELKPDWDYRFWLNAGKYNSFRSREGVILKSVTVYFHTRKK